MKDEMGTIITVVLIFVVVVIGVYPVQRDLAIYKFRWYIGKQRVDTSKIVEKKIFRDWKNGGYSIRVRFEDDEGKVYYYHYKMWTHRKDGKLKFHTMHLNVVDKGWRLEAPFEGKCKYPPIEDD